MSKTDFDRLFDQLEAMTVGYGPVFRDFQLPTNNYPPHNIVKISDSEFYIELAVAGFKKSEIQMEEHQGVLTIRGSKEIPEDIDLQKFQYRGIAGRSFSKSFRLAEYFDVAEAKVEDGILSVRFVQNIPDEAKPKLISIS